MIGDRAKLLAVTAGRDDGRVNAQLKMSGEPLARTVMEESGRVESVALDGWYVAYVEEDGDFRKRGLPFVVRCPLFGKTERVSGWGEVARLGAFDGTKWGWIVRWTNLCEGVFRAAELHPMLHIPFGIDVVKYITHLGEQECTDSLLAYVDACNLAGYIHKQKTTKRKM